MVLRKNGFAVLEGMVPAEEQLAMEAAAVRHFEGLPKGYFTSPLRADRSQVHVPYEDTTGEGPHERATFIERESELVRETDRETSMGRENPMPQERKKEKTSRDGLILHIPRGAAEEEETRDRRRHTTPMKRHSFDCFFFFFLSLSLSVSLSLSLSVSLFLSLSLSAFFLRSRGARSGWCPTTWCCRSQPGT